MLIQCLPVSDIDRLTSKSLSGSDGHAETHVEVLQSIVHECEVRIVPRVVVIEVNGSRVVPHRSVILARPESTLTAFIVQGCEVGVIPRVAIIEFHGSIVLPQSSFILARPESRLRLPTRVLGRLHARPLVTELPRIGDSRSVLGTLLILDLLRRDEPVLRGVGGATLNDTGKRDKLSPNVFIENPEKGLTVSVRCI